MDDLLRIVLRALLPKAGWAEYADVVAEDVFSNSTARLLYSMIARMHTETEADLSLDALRLNIQAEYRQGESRADELLAIVDALEEAPEVEHHALVAAVQKFVSREYLAQASRYIATHLGGDGPDASIVQGLVSRAVDVGERVHTEVLALHDFGLPGEVDDRPATVALGLSPQLDSCLGGGVAAGELLVLLAPPSRGKTSYLCAIGANAARAGRKVLHITLEVAGLRVARRYDSALTGLSRVDLACKPRATALAREKLDKAGGAVWIKDWSYADVTPADVKGLVRRMRASGQAVDMVVVDYLELLSPARAGQNHRREMRHMYGLIAKDMRAAAVGLGVPLVTAWQVNREGAKLDRIGTTDVSESWEVVKHADIILGLNQNDEEARRKSMRVSVLKQRDGTGRPMVELYSDLDRCTIRDRGEELVGDGKTITVGGGAGRSAGSEHEGADPDNGGEHLEPVVPADAGAEGADGGHVAGASSSAQPGNTATIAAAAATGAAEAAVHTEAGAAGAVGAASGAPVQADVRGILGEGDVV